MTTLEEALQSGRGNERPFQCLQHDDRHDSASVNVLKGVWHCFACQASGVVGKKTAPSAELLLAMLEPERGVRRYPTTWLELFAGTGYWNTRFPDWLCWLAHLGEDPFTGDGTYPVYTPNGWLAGVCRRQTEAQPKYLYPPRWSAARTLDGLGHFDADHVVLVEGAADRLALAEIGVPALAAYGSGLHMPQRELLLRLGIKQIYCGYDDDEAGKRASERTVELMADYVPCTPIQWSSNDPADCSPADRMACVVSVVGEGYLPQYEKRAATWQTRYQRYLEDL